MFKIKNDRSLCSALFAFSCWLIFSFSAFGQQGDENFNLHGQVTVVPQYHGIFTSPYEGTNSLNADQETKTSLTSTVFFGYRPWSHGEIYLDPELTAGSGLSATHGVADFTNGEIYRVDSPGATLNMSRFFLRQVFGFGEETLFINSDKNQLATYVPENRLVFTAGKLSLSDIFDGNAYSHDPRTQFLNWGLMNNAAWDYAADTRGYTWGAFIEWNSRHWALRAGTAEEPQSANGIDLDQNLAQAHGDNIEIEYRYSAGIHPGAVRLLGFINHAYMDNYAQAVTLNPSLPNIITTRSYSSKSGVGFNFQQELGEDWGLFSRWGYNDGKTESWAFSEVDSTASLGLAFKGQAWSQKDDSAGVAFIVSGLSPDHRDYLAHGGLGFMLGDGTLNYGPEEVAEIYYAYFIGGLTLSPDFQYVINPGFNRDRGPMAVFAMRVHGEF